MPLLKRSGLSLRGSFDNPTLISFEESSISRGVLLDRPNRFLGIAMVGGRRVRIHIHDPGRMPLLRSRTEIVLLNKDKLGRKTKYDLLAFKDRDEWIFAHSGYHSEIFRRMVSLGLFPISGSLRGEVPLGSSRIDFMAGSMIIEVKGCTWIVDDTGLFPDSPTKRGRKQIIDMSVYAKYCGEACVVFLVFSRRAKRMMIAEDVDPKFGEAVRFACRCGVRFLAYRLFFDGIAVRYVGQIPVVMTTSV